MKTYFNIKQSTFCKTFSNDRQSFRGLRGYSRVPNKRTGPSLENEKESHLYALIRNYTFINFQQKVPPIRLFPPILLLLLPNYITFLKFTMTHFDLRQP